MNFFKKLSLKPLGLGLMACSAVILCSCNILGNESKLDSSFRPGLPPSSGSNTGSTPADLTDDDNSSTGFGGGTKVGVSWNTNSTDKLILGPDTDCDGNMSEGETVYTNCAELDESWTPQWSSLVSYWKMNNDWNDSKGTNNGTVAGNAAFSSSAKVGSHSGTFDGTGDYVNVGDQSTLDFGSEYTITAWINRASTQVSADSAILAKLSSTTGYVGYMLYYNSNTVDLYINSANRVNSATSINANTWTYVVATWDGSTAKIYLNGLLDASSAYSTAPNSSGKAFRMGGYDFSGGNREFTGHIDEVAVWNKALNLAEIQTIYSRQSAKYAGQYTSRVMNYGSSIAWDGLKWLTTLPFGKELTGDANNSGTITAADSETSADYTSLVGSTGSTSNNDLMGGLVGLWHVNESGGTVVTDSSGNGNIGALTPSSTGVWGSGVLGNAATLNGSTQYISVPDSSSLAISGSSITLSTWVKTGDQSNAQSLISRWGGANSYVLILNWGSSNRVSFILAGTGVSLNSSITIGNGSWRFVAATYDGSNAVIYVDGTPIASQAGSGNINNNSANLRIGHDGTGLESAYLRGSIDEIAIWSRALHADEVKQLYRRGANRIKYQVRTCTSSDCSDNPTWLGNDNTKASYFSELHNYAPYNFDLNNCSATNLILTGSPSLLFDCFTGALSNLTSQQYFQYRAILESDDASTNCNYGSGATWCSPELKSVEIKP